VCLRVLKSEEARASVPQWYRRLWGSEKVMGKQVGQLPYIPTI